MQKKYVYRENFEGKILVMEKTGCGKTSFVQKIGVNNIFDDLKKVEWVSRINAEIQLSFEFIYLFIEIYFVLMTFILQK